MAVALQDADEGDTTTLTETGTAAANQIEDAQADVEEPQALEEIVADKGYHSNQTMVDFEAVEIISARSRLTERPFSVPVSAAIPALPYDSHDCFQTPRELQSWGITQ